MKKFLSVILVLAMIFGSFSFVSAVDLPILNTASASEGSIKIVYTNDVHCGYEKYDRVATLAKDADILVDGGDAIEGDLIGTVSKGQYAVDIMNYLNYDIAGLGNHEFDYSIEYLKDLIETSECDYVCCNMLDSKTKKLVFEPYKIIEVKGKKLAFIGVTTPLSLTQANPLLFIDETGNYIYSLCEGNNGKDLYNQVQKYVDEAKVKADYVILIAHLGTAPAASPWTVSEVASNINGVDLILDGHSHTQYTAYYPDKDGKKVPAVQNGTKLSHAAEIIIAEDGTIAVNSIPVDEIDPDKAAKSFLDTITEKVAVYKNKVVAESAVNLTTMYNGKRAVRNSETNIGDFCADAYRTVLGADIGFVNGGAIRTDINAGNITNGQFIGVHPYGNNACLVEVSGQQIKDALEFGYCMMPDESGGFLQVSGLTCTVDATKPSSVVKDSYGNFEKVKGEYRVSDIMIGGKPIELDKTYTLASNDYMLKSCGDGFSMFGEDNVKILIDGLMLDNQILIHYIVEELGGVVDSRYAAPQGRVKFIMDASECSKNYACPMNDFRDLDAAAWYHDGVHYCVSNGLMNGAANDIFDPDGKCTRGMLASVLYRLAGSPDVEMTTVFHDMSVDDYYAKAVSWCVYNGIVNGVEPHTFGGEAFITREQFATMLYRFADFAGKNLIIKDESNLDTFNDAATVRSFALPAIEWACGCGIINGNNGMLMPSSILTRAEMANMLYRYEN